MLNMCANSILSGMIPIFIITFCYNYFSTLYHRLIHSERGTNDNSVWEIVISVFNSNKLKEVHGPLHSPEQKFPVTFYFVAYVLWTFGSGELKPSFSFKFKKTQKLCFLIFLLHFFHICTLRRWLKLEIVKSCQKQYKVSTRINGDKDWEKIWVSWWWSQDEAGNCQQNCPHHWQF